MFDIGQLGDNGLIVCVVNEDLLSTDAAAIKSYLGTRLATTQVPIRFLIDLSLVKGRPQQRLARLATMMRHAPHIFAHPNLFEVVVVLWSWDGLVDPGYLAFRLPELGGGRVLIFSGIEDALNYAHEPMGMYLS
ncbi:MAG: hypothetical protein GYB64_16070 [Chloroflexi bacterium]|nr:hypothetical protein [Chloroflexota bacterium]